MTSIARAIVTFLCVFAPPFIGIAVVAVGLFCPFGDGDWREGLKIRGYLVLTGWSLLAALAHGTTGGDA